ncbi:MAG: hypothetical protein AB7P97_21455 [Hyphomonadaceae bacterium]
MPKKCESCRFFKVLVPDDFENSVCTSLGVNSDPDVNYRRVPTMTEAREICNKEGDGIFVYFQPKAETRAVSSVPAQPRRTAA